MAVDHEQLRAERVRVAAANRAGDWSQREAELIARDRAELAAQREAEQHQDELAKFASFAERKAKDNPADAELWKAAASNAGKGLWTIARRISADPEIMRFGALRTRLNYQGKNVQLND